MISAALVTSENEVTGYKSVWVRDNEHILNAHRGYLSQLDTCKREIQQESHTVKFGGGQIPARTSIASWPMAVEMECCDGVCNGKTTHHVNAPCIVSFFQINMMETPCRELDCCDNALFIIVASGFRLPG